MGREWREFGSEVGKESTAHFSSPAWPIVGWGATLASGDKPGALVAGHLALEQNNAEEGT